MVDVKTLDSPHILRLWLRVSNGMLSVKYHCSNNAFLCQSRLMEIIDYYKDEIILATLGFADIARLKALVYVCILLFCDLIYTFLCY